MIRLNLIPYRPARRLKRVQTIVAAWGFSVFLGLGGAYAFDAMLLGDIDALAAKKEAQEKTIAQLEKDLGEVKDINAKKQAVQNRLDAIADLRRQRSVSVRVMDEVAKAIPDQVWLTAMSTEKGQISLSGSAASNAEVADFMRRLEESPLFEGVDLSRVSMNDNQGRKKIRTFTLNARVTPPAPPPKPGEEKPAGGGAP
ncbi:MAG: PilN domain-containing protein [Magnetococcales bacterium]|nr:PilN domain-containing protein [Magnetococcales bacterium]